MANDDRRDRDDEREGLGYGGYYGYFRDQAPQRRDTADFTGAFGRASGGELDAGRISGPFGEPRGRRDFTGRGPRGYRRSDERIADEVNEALTRDPDVDATDIAVRVAGGEVTLEGTVEDRRMKRLAEGAAESVSGVVDVHNRLRLVGTSEREATPAVERETAPQRARGATGSGRTTRTAHDAREASGRAR